VTETREETCHGMEMEAPAPLARQRSTGSAQERMERSQNKYHQMAVDLNQQTGLFDFDDAWVPIGASRRLPHF